MAKKVFYFSRSGNSKRIAEKITAKLNCGMTEITDDVSWKGIFGYMRGGYYSITGKTTRIELTPATDVKEQDAVILVVPLWAGNVAPAGYSFLIKEKDNIKKLFMLIDNDGSDVDKTFAKLEKRVGKIDNKYGVTKHKNNEDEVIENLCRDAADF